MFLHMGMSFGKLEDFDFSKIFSKIVKITKASSTTQQNRVPGALGVLKSKSTWKMLPKSWFKVEKGARKVCFMTETMLKIYEKYWTILKHI